jgi:hypothetical protein
VAFARQKIGKVGEPCCLFAIGAVELIEGGRGIGGGLGHLDQVLIARQFAGQKRIGEDFAQLADAARRLALQLIKVDLVDRRQFQQQLHGQRALVALDEVQIGR